MEKRVLLQDVIPLETPFLLYIDPSSACNFRCQFCPTGHKDIIKDSEYRRSMMNFNVFKKVISDLGEFDRPLKVLRMNKIGEPLLNKHLPKMIKFAKESGHVEYIDLATNGSLLSHETMSQIISSGLDRLNISVEGVNREQYLEHAKVIFNFESFVDNIHWLYANKKNCEITIKIPSNYLTSEHKEIFLNIFGDYCDRIFIEELAPIWPLFDLERRAGTRLKGNKGQYLQQLDKKDICTYIFYAMAVNSDGTVSACCPDWDQKLIIGNVKNESLHQTWNSEKMNALRHQHLEKHRCDNIVCSNCGHLRYAQVDNIDPYREQILKKILNYEKRLLS
jgi:radical SAM protein with 4Fe4S-binding SPASM domain